MYHIRNQPLWNSRFSCARRSSRLPLQRVLLWGLSSVKANADPSKSLNTPETPPDKPWVCTPTSTHRPDTAATAKVDEFYMWETLQLAQEALDAGEVPVGALIVENTSGEVIARGRNATVQLLDPTAHAEVRAIQEAARRLQAWQYLKDCTLYVTLEPCPMCAGAILQARLGRVVYGARNPLLGGDGSWAPLLRAPGAYTGVIRGEEKNEEDDHVEPHSDDQHQQQQQQQQQQLTQQSSFSPPDIQATGRRARRRRRLASEKQNKTEEGQGDWTLGVTPWAKRPTGPHPFCPNLQVSEGIMKEECGELMQTFFRSRRVERDTP